MLYSKGESSTELSRISHEFLLNKSAIRIYTSYEKAYDAWDAFKREESSASRYYQIKRFKLDGPAMIYAPY